MKHIQIILLLTAFFACNSHPNKSFSKEIEIISAIYLPETIENEQKYQIQIMFKSNPTINIKKIIFRKHVTTNFSLIKNTINATLIINSNFIKKSDITSMKDGVIYEIKGKEYFTPVQFIYKK